ncbi:MAG: glutamine synthetase beta-grasp domain-containing protein [Patescibacteria group bacterium]
MKVKAEYIWIDGRKPTAKLRSKTRIIERPDNLKDVPNWGFDGSSTNQAVTTISDCALKPVYFLPDPLRREPHIIVMCEVFQANGKVHPTNTRARLRQTSKKYSKHESWFGLEQEYTLYDRDGVRPYRWPEGAAFPAPQGHYYCGVGSDEVFGRQLIEAHTNACLEAGILISGTNAEVMPSQWEFQLGPLGPLEVSDQLWLARWLLYRLGEDRNISAKLDPKPISGDWNGAGCHVNFSTKEMRAKGGLKVIEKACVKLGQFHKQHITVYGADNDKRLTGKHETCDINTFRYAVSDRGASIRIPMATNEAGCGYLEDRRPAANIDPYEVCNALLETVCGNGFKP